MKIEIESAPPSHNAQEFVFMLKEIFEVKAKEQNYLPAVKRLLAQYSDTFDINLTSSFAVVSPMDNGKKILLITF